VSVCLCPCTSVCVRWPELIDAIEALTEAELGAYIARGDLMLPSVQAAMMALAELRRRGL
jgi:hypothetical protein